ncbi:speckle-type POZ protein-like [Planococcus citri]|uniref:speckle-type POZ protein-like n=1 Tax=Planococcus citri TaxID=170843 RepID=UPI0031F9EA9D
MTLTRFLIPTPIHFRSTYYDRDLVYIILFPASDTEFKRCSPISGTAILLPKLLPIRTRESYARVIEESFKLSYDGLTHVEIFFSQLDTCLSHLASSRNALHIECNLKYMKTIPSSNTCAAGTLSQLNSFGTGITECSLSRDFERIRIDEQPSDMTNISVKGKNYPVHKDILADRSSVFDAMFKSDTQESRENHIIITDIEQNIFEEMLRYIYTGKTENLNGLAYELLPVADKYDLRDLKTMCEQALSQILSAENAAAILILADMHSAKKLKSYTIQFIKQSYASNGYEDFKNTEFFKFFSTHRPDLMSEMMAAFFE